MPRRLLLWFTKMIPANIQSKPRNRLVDFLNVLLQVRVFFAGFPSFRARGSTSRLAWLDMESVSEGWSTSSLSNFSIDFWLSIEVASSAAGVFGGRTIAGCSFSIGTESE